MLVVDQAAAGSKPMMKSISDSDVLNNNSDSNNTANHLFEDCPKKTCSKNKHQPKVMLKGGSAHSEGLFYREIKSFI